MPNLVFFIDEVPAFIFGLPDHWFLLLMDRLGKRPGAKPNRPGAPTKTTGQQGNTCIVAANYDAMAFTFDLSQYTHKALDGL
jgi:hypothetical protein